MRAILRIGKACHSVILMGPVSSFGVSAKWFGDLHVVSQPFGRLFMLEPMVHLLQQTNAMNDNVAQHRASGNSLSSRNSNVSATPETQFQRHKAKLQEVKT